MIVTRKLANGIRMVLEPMPQVQSIAMGIWCGTGAVDENEKNAGVSHFVEHMMFKGTEKRNARQIAADIDRIGGQMNAFTGKEATCYYVKCVSDNYKKAADVLVDMVENSLFEKKEMDRERQVICEEIKMTKDSPDDLCHDTFITQIYRGNSMGNSILGTPTSLKRVTHNVMKQYVEDHYVRDNIVVSVAGKFDVDDVCDYFSQQFGTLKQSKGERVLKKKDYEPSCRVITRDIQQSHVCMGTKAISLVDDRFYGFQILNNILGGSMSSRLFQNIREQKGLAYSVYSMTGASSRDGYFEIYAGVSHDKIRAAIEGIREELEKLAAEPVTQDELDSSREQMLSGYVFSQESTSTRMVVNGKNYLLLDRVFTPEEVMEGYHGVTIDQIDEIKGLITDFSQYTAAVVSGKRCDLRSMMK